MEYRRFPPGQSPVSTFEFHEHRERAPHLEQGAHRARLEMAEVLIADYFLNHKHNEGSNTVVDLGCGDGGLMQLVEAKQSPRTVIIGYDFQPTNLEGWKERHVAGLPKNFIEKWSQIPEANLYVLTEVLEHLEEPHRAVQRVADRGAALVASSPLFEHEGSIDGCHNWAWDREGYIKMIEGSGFQVVRWERVDWSQVLLAVPR